MDLSELASAVDEATVFARQQLVKAALPANIATRDKAIADNADAFTADVAAYFEGLAERVAAKIHKADEEDFVDGLLDWDEEEDALRKVIGPWYMSFGDLAYAHVGEQLGVDLAFDLNERGVQGVVSQLAQRVTNVNDYTKSSIGSAVAEWTESGNAVTSLKETVSGLIGDWAGSRSTMIALTESANAYNISATAGYRDSGLVEEVEVFDGDDCGWTEHTDADMADGSTRTLDDADEYPISHPNCQRAFAPVVAR